MSTTVKFDPGIGDLVSDIYEYVNNVYSAVANVKSYNRKRAKFNMYAPSIRNRIKNNIAFYSGCLLWAYHIKKSNESSPVKIEGNHFLHLSQEQIEKYDYLIQINFLENFINIFEKEVLKYTGKKFETPVSWKTIIKIYKEFLDLNKGFINTESTSDLILPEALDRMTFESDINEMIKNAIEKKDLNILLLVDNFNFNT